MGTSKKKSSGSYIALGTGVGVTFGIIFNNLTLGIVFGCAVGVIIESMSYYTKKK